MAFKRTKSGIANQNLFHNVDFVVFVEGGSKSFTKEEVENDNYNNESDDIIFWERIFKKYKTNVSLKFKAVGSKSTVLKIAEDIAVNNISTAYVAMDKEFDDILGKQIDSNKILYTYGYSWENDALSKELLKELLEDLTAKSVEDSLIFDPYEKFIKELKLSVYADGYQFSKSDSFFPRQGYLRCVNCDLKNEPKLKKDEIDSLITQNDLNKSTLYSFGNRNSIDTEKYCYGHLLADFCWHLISYLLKTVYKLKPVNKKVINRLILNKFIDNFDQNKDDFYKKQFA